MKQPDIQRSTHDGPRTLKSDIRRVAEFVGEHKWQALGGVAVLLALGGVVERTANSNSQVQAAQSQSDERAAFDKALKAAALRIANPDDVIPGSTITNPGSHLYDDAKKFADEHGISYSEDTFDTLLESSTAIDAAELIQAGTTTSFVIAEYDADGKGPKEVIVQRAPVDLDTK